MTEDYETQKLRHETEDRLAAEQAACAQQPAVAVNRYHIAIGKNHVRLAFMEVTPPYGWCRAVVTMDKADAIALANSLALVLSEGTKQ